jgi:hypothetical protein
LSTEQQAELDPAEKAKADLRERKLAMMGTGGGSDDDSVLYIDRIRGEGTTIDDHSESVYDIDFDTKEKKVRGRRCKLHPREFARYVCIDHEMVLCPRCLVSHKVCDFQPMGETLAHEAKQRFRNLNTIINLRHNLTKATERKLKKTISGLDMYRDVQYDEIDFSFNKMIETLNLRRNYLK